MIAVAAGIGGTALASEALRVRIDAETKYQVIDGFPNSPPVHLTRNGKGYADKGPPHLNVKHTSRTNSPRASCPRRSSSARPERLGTRS